MNHTDPTAVLARIRQMADYWEQQLPEVIRTPAVVSALRAAMEGVPAVVAPPTSRAAEAELYVLLRKAGEDRHEAQALIDRHRDEVLRRLAAEAQQQEEPEPCSGCLLVPCGACPYLKARREAEAKAQQQPTDEDAVEAHRLALSFALDLGNGAPWQAILERAGDLSRRDVEAQQQPDTEAHPPQHTWKVESPRREQWASWGATYDDRDWAREMYESATSTAPQRPFRLVRATTTYTVETEHNPNESAPAEQQPAADGDEETPVCQGFVWIGQSFATCDRCAQPAWEHDGEEVPIEGAGPFDTGRTVRPWKPGQVEAIRAKWGPRP